MNDIKLYEHNQDLYERTLNVINTGLIKDILITETMGGGKSFVVMKLIHTLKEKYPRVLFIYPTFAIKDNISSYKEFELIKDNVTFVSQGSFLNINNTADYYHNYDLFIYDEAHHIGAEKSGKAIKLLKELISKSDNKLLIGLTGTEYRDSDKVHTKDLFSIHINGNEIIDFIEKGLMPKFDYVICTPDIDDDKTLKQINKLGKVDIKSSKQYIKSIIDENKDKKKWLVYFDNIERCDESVDYIKSLFPDYKVYVIHSKTSISDNWINELNSTEKAVIMSVDKLIEGIHLEGFTAGIIFRNVGSIRIYKQMLGRFNKMGQKESPLIIDCSQAAYRVWKNIIKSENNINTFTNARRNTVNNVNNRLYSIVNSKYIDINNLLEDIKNTPTIKEQCKEKSVSYKGFTSYKHKHPNVTIEEYMDYIKNKPKTLSQQCKEKGVNYVNYLFYKQKHPDATLEEYVDYVKNKPKTIEQQCKEKSVSYKGFTSYKHKHPDATIEEYVDYVKNKSKSLLQQCKKRNVSYSGFSYYKHKHPNATIEEYVDYVKNKPKSLLQQCKEKGVRYGTFVGYKRQHPNTTIEEYVDYVKNKPKTIEQQCKEKGMSYHGYLGYRRNHPGTTLEEYVDYVKNKPKTIEQQCKEKSVSYKGFTSYKHKHPDATIEEYVDYIKNKSKSLKQQCKEKGVNYKGYLGYRHNHPGATVEEYAKLIKNKQKKTTKEN